MRKTVKRGEQGITLRGRESRQPGLKTGMNKKKKTRASTLETILLRGEGKKTVDKEGRRWYDQRNTP